MSEYASTKFLTLQLQMAAPYATFASAVALVPYIQNLTWKNTIVSKGRLPGLAGVVGLGFLGMAYVGGAALQKSTLFETADAVGRPHPQHNYATILSTSSKYSVK